MSARSLLPIVVFAMVLPVLAGCETMGSWIDGGNRVSVKNASSKDIPSVMPASNVGSSNFTDDQLRNLATTSSGGSVEVYSIDGGADERSLMSIASQPSPYGFGSLAVKGAPYSGDPSVTVFSLDDINDAGGARYAPMVPAPFADVANPEMGGAKLGPVGGKEVSRVYFEYGSARIGGNDDRILKEAANIAKFAPVDRIRVEGHASVDTQTNDPVKARMLNLKESMNRAYSVSRRLIEQGVPAEKIKTVAWGDTVPASSNKEQRRVDIITGAGY
jgi:outer membrane protein OmpA-like peptidoglycan-associated protein